MRSPLPSTVVIACPHCGTRYQVTMDAIGPRGRQVQCAHCAKAWQAELESAPGRPEPEREPDRMFDDAAERELDAAFAAEEDAVTAEQFTTAIETTEPARSPGAEPTPEALSPAAATSMPARPAAEARGDPAQRRKREKALNRRHDAIAKQSPLARVRRTARLISLSVLVALITGGIIFRAEIVRTLPDLAGAYEALGLGVNVVGLEFREVTTVLAVRDGAPVLRVDARIYSIAKRGLPVPPVVVSLLDQDGASLYQWSVNPDAQDLEPGEAVEFSTQLNAPPAAATQVRLSFSPGRAQVQGRATNAITTETP